jgi:hypothetical protein
VTTVPAASAHDINMIKEEEVGEDDEDEDESGFNKSKFHGKVDSNHGGKQVSFQFRFLHDRVRQVGYLLIFV